MKSASGEDLCTDSGFQRIRNWREWKCTFKRYDPIFIQIFQNSTLVNGALIVGNHVSVHHVERTGTIRVTDIYTRENHRFPPRWIVSKNQLLVAQVLRDPFSVHCFRHDQFIWKTFRALPISIFLYNFCGEIDSSLTMMNSLIQFVLINCTNCYKCIILNCRVKFLEMIIINF